MKKRLARALMNLVDAPGYHSWFGKRFFPFTRDWLADLLVRVR